MTMKIPATVHAFTLNDSGKSKDYFLEYFPETTYRKIRNLEKRLMAKADSEGIHNLRIESIFLKYAKPEFDLLSKNIG